MAVAPSQVHGSKLLVLLVRTNKQYREEFAWFVGSADLQDEGLFVDRGSEGPSLKVPEFAVPQIRECDGPMQKAFAAADFVLSLRVEADGGEELAAFDQVGLAWEA